MTASLSRWIGIAAALLIVAAAVAALMAWRLHDQSAPASPDLADTPLLPTRGVPWFVDVTKASGITFQHFDSATPMDYIQESLGSGIAWIDYNNDGWPDLFCVQAGPLKGAPDPTRTNKLYRNNGDGTFTDVTEQVGLARAGFGLGCAVGDYDNDGWDDLVVAYQGGVVLYHNESDGKGGRRFVDVTAHAHLDNNPHLATSCAWGDIDGDGLLDLYVCNYVEVDFDHYPDCIDANTKLRRVCSPNLFPCVAHRLYRNNGDGTFSDITDKAGISAVRSAPGLAVVMCDLDGDGRIDIFVANDMRPAFLFHNQGDGRFAERALASGCALDSSGEDLAGMGIDAGDLDGSGRPSLFVTNFQKRPNILYRNLGKLRFQDASFSSGLGAANLDHLSFGTVFLDADLDGRLDVAVATGHIQRNAEQILGVSQAQTALLFTGDGQAHFRNVSSQAGAYFHERRIGRGLACADYNNDGRPDLVFSHLGGPIALLQNQTQTDHHWLRLELVGDGHKSNRNAIGARVEIEAGGRRQVRFLNGGGSYLSANERRMLVGLGDAPRAERVTVVWPSGRRQEFHELNGRSWYRLEEGNEQPKLVTPGPAAK